MCISYPGGFPQTGLSSPLYKSVLILNKLSLASSFWKIDKQTKVPLNGATDNSFKCSIQRINKRLETTVVLLQGLEQFVWVILVELRAHSCLFIGSGTGLFFLFSSILCPGSCKATHYSVSYIIPILSLCYIIVWDYMEMIHLSGKGVWWEGRRGQVW